MKAFQFHLQRVHDLRELDERRALGALGEALAQVTLVEAKIVELCCERARVEGELTKLLTHGALDTGKVALWHSMLEELEVAIAAARTDLTAARRRVELAQDRVEHCRAERKATEKLRAVAQEEWQIEAGRMEQRELDEVAAQQYLRKGEAP